MELAKPGCGFILRALRLLLYQSSSAASYKHTPHHTQSVITTARATGSDNARNIQYETKIQLLYIQYYRI